jgi:hypothetical protein
MDAEADRRRGPDPKDEGTEAVGESTGVLVAPRSVSVDDVDFELIPSRSPLRGRSQQARRLERPQI